MGIAEQDMVSTAAGLSTCGKIPFASSFAVFLTGRAYDQVRNSVAYPNLNVKLCGTHAGVTVGEDGATHQMLEDISITRTLPNLKVFCPADEIETRWLIKEIAKIEGPCYVRLGRSKVPQIYDENEKFEIGKFKVFGEGTDATIFASGVTVSEALIAKDELEKEGINVRVVDVCSIKPLDEETILKCAKETKKLISVEDHMITGGIGSAIAEVLTEKYPAKLVRMGINDSFGRSGKAGELVKYYGLDSASIIKTVKE
jgi:transketolase